MKRIPTQTVLPFARADRVLNRQIRDKAEGRKIRRGPGRPPKRRGVAGVTHQARPQLKREKTALHVTVKATALVPNLRAKRRFAVIKQAFVRFCGHGKSDGFRLIHFAVLSNHAHFVVEADSTRALSLGMQRLLHSISRRLNALNVKEHGGRVSTHGGSYKALPGWIGRVFKERYHAHELKTPTEIGRAIAYVLTNAEKHYGAKNAALSDPFTSAVTTLYEDKPLIVRARGFLLARAAAAFFESLRR